MRNSKGQFVKGHTQPTAKVIKKGQKLALGYKWTEEQKKNNPNLFKKGQRVSPATEFKKGQKMWEGKKRSEETKKKISESRKGKCNGESHWAWKGGTYDKDRKIDMGRTKYRKWRKAVLKRDNYTCVLCGRTFNLNVDHIKPYACYPELRHTLENGRTLCVICHKMTETYGRRTSTWHA